MESTSTRLKKAMSVRNMSQADLAEKTKISKGALSSYISGRYTPKQNNIFLLAKALDVSEDWLIGADVPMEASLINIIRRRLVETRMTMEEVSDNTGVPLHWLQHIDTFIPDAFENYEIGYEWITRVADILRLPGSVLRTALARQETAVPAGRPQPAAKKALEEINICRPEITDKIEPLSAPEKDHIKKYRLLDSHGKKMVDFTLNEEWERSMAETSNTDHVIPLAVREDARCINAAHAIENATEEDRQFDEHIMDDENF